MDGQSTQLLTTAIDGWTRALANAPDARRRLATWGAADAALLERHRIGFVDGRLAATVPRRGEIARRLRDLGVIDGAGNERHAGAIAIPVLDDAGAPVQVAFYDGAGRSGGSSMRPPPGGTPRASRANATS